MANAWECGYREDYLRAVEFASPEFVENVLKAARMATQGATTPTGKVIFDEKGNPIRETIGEAIAQGSGFRPARIAAAETHREYTNIQGNFSERERRSLCQGKNGHRQARRPARGDNGNPKIQPGRGEV